MKGTATYKTLEVLGPEHEFSVVNDQLKALPIVDSVLKSYHGRIVNSVQLPRFTFGKELQMYVQRSNRQRLLEASKKPYGSALLRNWGKGLIVI